MINYLAVVEASSIIVSVLITGWFVVLVEMIKSKDNRNMNYFNMFIIPISFYFISIILGEISISISLLTFSIGFILTLVFMILISQRLKYDIDTEKAANKK